MRLFLSLGISLLATLLLEGGAALLCKRRGVALLAVVAVNLLTNPGAVLLMHLTGENPLIFWAIEGAIVLVEGLALFRLPLEFPKPFRFSLLINSISCLAGIIIGGIL